MSVAFVLITTEPHKEAEVYKKVSELQNAEYAVGLFGEYDVLAKMVIDSEHPFESLIAGPNTTDDIQGKMGYLVVEQIRSIPGVKDTKTLNTLIF